jgi:anti-repressor protein
MNTPQNDQSDYLLDFDVLIAAAPEEEETTLDSLPCHAIPIMANDSLNTVNARDLHSFLGVGKDFSNWIKDRIDSFGFTKGNDYSPISADRSDGLPGKPRTEYLLSLQMAKELSMLERSPRGKQARQYFIKCEEELIRQSQDPVTLLNDPAAMRGLLLDYCERVLALQEEVKTLAPKAAGLDLIAGTEGSMCISDAAKTLGQRPRSFFATLSNARWIFRRGNEWIPFQDKQDKGWMEAKVTLIPIDGLDKITTQARITPAGLAQLAKMIGRVSA